MYNIYGSCGYRFIKGYTSGLYVIWSVAALDTQLTLCRRSYLRHIYTLYIINARVCICRYKGRMTR